MSASGLTIDSTKQNGSRNYCERLRCRETSHPIRTEIDDRNSRQDLSRQDLSRHDLSRHDDSRRVNNDPREKQPRQNQQLRRDKLDIHGWIVLDKPIGMASTQAVAVVKRLFSAKRAGHAGTLDPLASGGLPIALGEATKTVPFVMDGRKRYRFTV